MIPTVKTETEPRVIFEASDIAPWYVKNAMKKIS